MFLNFVLEGSNNGLLPPSYSIFCCRDSKKGYERNVSHGMALQFSVSPSCIIDSSLWSDHYGMKIFKRPPQTFQKIN
jgi:hypothetical protein